MGNGQDDPAVIGFLTAFQKLRHGIEDRPQDLLAMAIDDEGVRRLALKLEKAAKTLSDAERRKPELFSSPVNPGFISTWRAFEEHYAGPISDVSFYDVIGVTPEGLYIDGKRRDIDPYELEDKYAELSVLALDTAIDFAFQQISDETRDFDYEYVEQVQEGVEAWEKLAAQFGPDLKGVFRRRAVAPFVLIPRHVSRRHGDSEKLSLLTHLQQAQAAFVCGAPYAALALMRTILEVTLTEHYGAEGRNLKQWIRNCPDLPIRAPAAALDRLRRDANAVLHFNQDEVTVSDNMEKDLLQHLFVLRALIEGAPEK